MEFHYGINKSGLGVAEEDKCVLVCVFIFVITMAEFFVLSLPLWCF